MNPLSTSIAAVGVAYLCGSIPTAWLVFRYVRGGDIRDHGSGNMGATNLMRFCGGRWALATLAIDVLKGAAPVLAARWLLLEELAEPWAPPACAVAAVVGHCWPIWLGLRGGKGAATGLGVFAGLAPLAALVSTGVFLLLALPTRTVSLGSMGAAATAPFWTWLMGYGTPSVLAAVACAVLIVGRHHANIRRLLSGKEGRVGERGV